MSRSPSRSPTRHVRSRSPSPNGYISDDTRSEYSVASEAPPDLRDLDDLLGTMRGMLASLGNAFDTLGEQAARVSRVGPAVEAEWHITKLSKTLAMQSAQQTIRIEEMDELFRTTLPGQVASHMGAVVNEMVRVGIERRIQEGVAREVARLPPHSNIKALSDKLEIQKRQLREVRASLTNAEARRHNSTLRSHNLHDPLRPLLPPQATSDPTLSPSPLFPSTLTALFSASTNTAKALLRAYGLEVDESGPGAREKNLNRFMSFIGVPFQMVPAPTTPTATIGTGATAIPLIAQAHT
ncbi:hypothetical protein BKA62DRAFT_714977 [Auriculariales sp. MPI-PUGE-AT-0066]|nr:hypothetical protein BKA62DRAFT_714977 [Auriculariales sp. MPI-PUGE-AT-0066]